MPVKTISVLKTYFETGDRPTESQFADLIDSFIHKTTGSVITARSYDEETGQVIINFSNGLDPLIFNIAKSESEEISFINGLQDALDNKVDKEAGKGLSSNDLTNELYTKLLNIVGHPDNETISFITGLQDALNLKANDDEVVKIVTFNGTDYAPDGDGRVTIEAETGGGGEYNLSLSPEYLGKKYFGENIRGVFLDIPDTGGSNWLFNHQLDVGRYFKIQLWEKDVNNTILGDDPIKDLTSFLLAVSPSAEVEVNANELIIRNYALTSNYQIYIEYTGAAIPTEGIGVDVIGSSAIGA